MELKLPDKVWNGASAVTAFAAAQALAFMYAMTNAEFAAAASNGKVLVIVAVVLFHVAYVWAIHRCHREFRHLTSTSGNSDDAGRVSRMVQSGQTYLVAFFGLLSLFAANTL